MTTPHDAPLRLGTTRELFLDNHVVQWMDKMTRRVMPARKHPRNPLVVPVQPWEPSSYLVYGSVLFERLIAYRRTVGTAVFAIYVADALGYTGSVVVQLWRDLFAGEGTRFDFFRIFSYAMSVGGVVLLLVSSALLLGKGREPTA